MTRAEMLNLVEGFDVHVNVHAPDKRAEFADKFCRAWPTFKGLLVTLKDLPFTGPKVDHALEQIVQVGDDICGGAGATDANIAAICQYWGVAKPALIGLKLITPKKVDRVIDEVIKMIDLVCD